jgi:hypothetical protein
MIRFWTSIDLRLRLALVALVIAFLPVAWYLGSPLFINRTVNESFPASASAAQGQSASMAATDVPAAMGANMAGNSASMPAATADASMSMAENMAATSVPTAMSANMADNSASMPAPDAPVVLGSGHFGAIDFIHKGQGQATIYKLPDGKRVLRFEQFQVANGPDLYVYLSGHPAPREDAQVRQDGFEVAVLKGNIGDQNYDVPADIDLSKYRSVTIWCRRFSANFATAPLKQS